MRLHVLALWLSGGVPCIVYMFTASGHAYWLDSGEFVAASVLLDIAHPPGHPLSALWGKAWSLLPIGSLSLRVALGQAVASAAASVWHFRATRSALRGLRLDPDLEGALALFASWTCAFSYALWFQAVRPEVYALQTLCVAAICERLVAHAASDRAQPFVTACAIFGLALTNHHLIAFLLAPAFVPGLVRLLRARCWRSLASAVALAALGLGAYLYLPLRAARAPLLNLGDPSSLARFGWVVSARVYAHDMGQEAVQPLATRALDVIALWLADFPGPLLLLACVGAYLSLRLPTLRRAGVVLLLVPGSDAFARAWLGPVRANPDILGYLAPSYLAIASLLACGLAGAAWLVQQRWPAARLHRLAWALPLAALALAPSGFARSSLADFSAVDAFDDPRIRQLPARAIVLESSPQAVFRGFELAAVEGARPDVLEIPLPFLRYPGMTDAVLRRAPQLAPLLHRYLAAHDHLPLAPLVELARERPVFVELDTRIEPALFAHLRPMGLLTEVAPQPVRVGRAELAALFARQEQRLQQQLGSQAHETETAHQLLWVHYMNAVQLGALGLRDLARAELARARALHPEESRLRQLDQALLASGPLDATPFLRF